MNAIIIRRFQFSLRTMFIVVTLVAIVCGYVAQQYQIVQRRRALVNQHVNTVVLLDANSAFAQDGPYPRASVSSLRRWFGDSAVAEVWVTDAACYEEVKQLFPESEVSLGSSLPFISDQEAMQQSQFQRGK